MSWASVRRAQHVLGIRPRKAGDGPWLWGLPEKDPPPSGAEQVEHLEHLPRDPIENGDLEHPELPEPTEGAQTASVNNFVPDEQLWHEPDLKGLIPDGWAAEAWIDWLERLASGCESLNPELAAQHRKQAAVIRAALEKTKGGDSP